MADEVYVRRVRAYMAKHNTSLLEAKRAIDANKDICEQPRNIDDIEIERLCGEAGMQFVNSGNGRFIATHQDIRNLLIATKYCAAMSTPNKGESK